MTDAMRSDLSANSLEAASMSSVLPHWAVLDAGGAVEGLPDLTRPVRSRRGPSHGHRRRARRHIDEAESIAEKYDISRLTRALPGTDRRADRPRRQ